MLVLAVIYLAASAIIALGYSIFYFDVQLPNGSVGQLLDIMDYVSNSVMMPFIALLSTILIGWVMTPDYVIDEMQRNGETFRRKKLYRVMIRYVAPVMMLVLFCSPPGSLLKPKSPRWLLGNRTSRKGFTPTRPVPLSSDPRH